MKKLLSAMMVVPFLGCATIMNTPFQGVAVNSTPSGAKCKADNGKEFETPKIVSLARFHGHVITCERPGYQPASAAINRGFSAWVFGNVVFGLLPGLIVDTITGSLGKLKPANIELTMAPMQTPPMVSPGTNAAPKTESVTERK